MCYPLLMTGELDRARQTPLPASLEDRSLQRRLKKLLYPHRSSVVLVTAMSTERSHFRDLRFADRPDFKQVNVHRHDIFGMREKGVTLTTPSGTTYFKIGFAEDEKGNYYLFGSSKGETEEHSDEDKILDIRETDEILQMLEANQPTFRQRFSRLFRRKDPDAGEVASGPFQKRIKDK